MKNLTLGVLLFFASCFDNDVRPINETVQVTITVQVYGESENTLSANVDGEIKKEFSSPGEIIVFEFEDVNKDAIYDISIQTNSTEFQYTFINVTSDDQVIYYNTKPSFFIRDYQITGKLTN